MGPADPRARRAVPVVASVVALVAIAVFGPSARDAQGAAGAPRTRRMAVSAPRALVVVATRRAAAWATALPPVVVENRNAGTTATVRLYRDDGTLDEDATRAFMRAVATPGNDDASEPLAPRLVQLVLRASYHFGGKRVRVVSATRKGAHGKHGTGEAIDFAIDGVRSPLLAAYLRGLARVGVGIYTHPRTQYVHLDVREQSFHWLDASPPGVTWRERRLPDPKQEKRDEAWTARADLPESAL